MIIAPYNLDNPIDPAASLAAGMSLFTFKQDEAPMSEPVNAGATGETVGQLAERVAERLRIMLVCIEQHRAKVIVMPPQPDKAQPAAVSPVENPTPVTTPVEASLNIAHNLISQIQNVLDHLYDKV